MTQRDYFLTLCRLRFIAGALLGALVVAECWLLNASHYKTAIFVAVGGLALIVGDRLVERLIEEPTP